MHVYIHIYVYIYVCIYISIYTYIYIYTYICASERPPAGSPTLRAPGVGQKIEFNPPKRHLLRAGVSQWLLSAGRLINSASCGFVDAESTCFAMWRSGF